MVTDADAARAEVLAAREEVLASRAALLDEVQRLEASARAAVDIPGKVRRNPARTAGLAAGSAFLLFGGPQRLFRRARRTVRRGKEAELPKSLLPDEIDNAVRRLGSDGDKVRGTLEREFVHYLDERAKIRRESSIGSIAMLVAKNVLRPVSFSAGRRLATELFSPDAHGFETAMERARTRYAELRGEPRSPDAAAGEPQAAPGSAASPGSSRTGRGG